jgi:anti-sigma B factor antagonist
MNHTATDPTYGPGNLRLVAETDDIAVLCLEGDFDLANASEITLHSDELLAAGKHLIIDLSDATFIDSHVVRALYRVATQARRSGRLAVLELHTAAIVERVVEICAVQRVIPRVHDRTEAIHTIRLLDLSADRERSTIAD